MISQSSHGKNMQLACRSISLSLSLSVPVCPQLLSCLLSGCIADHHHDPLQLAISSAPLQVILIYIHGGLEKINKIGTQKIILKDDYLQSTISVISSKVLDAGWTVEHFCLQKIFFYLFSLHLLFTQMLVSSREEIISEETYRYSLHMRWPPHTLSK